MNENIVSLAIPSNAREGDLLAVLLDSCYETVTPPAGWSLGCGAFDEMGKPSFVRRVTEQPPLTVTLELPVGTTAQIFVLPPLSKV